MSNLKPEDVFEPAEWQEVTRAFATLYLYREKLELVKRSTPPTKEEIDQFLSTIENGLAGKLEAGREQRQS